MTNKSAPTQKQRKRRYEAWLADEHKISERPVRVIGRNNKTGKLWIKARGMSTRLVDESEVTS